jgi:hypothetical protein
MKRSRYEVGFSESLWYVHDLESGKREFYPTKAIAVSVGIAVAKGDKPSSLYIKGRDGQYQEERTYGGIDPFPPKG